MVPCAPTIIERKAGGANAIGQIVVGDKQKISLTPAMPLSLPHTLVSEAHEKMEATSNRALYVPISLQSAVSEKSSGMP